jgi:hypothetical protein
MMQFARDFQYYRNLGFSIVEAFDIARTLRRARKAIGRSGYRASRP